MTRDDTTQASGKVNGHPTREGATRQPGDGAPPTPPALMTRAEVKSINQLLAEHDEIGAVAEMLASFETEAAALRAYINHPSVSEDMLRHVRVAVGRQLEARRQEIRTRLARMGVEA